MDLAQSGLQAERTALSWQRTALSLAVATGAWERLSHPQLGAVADAVTVVLVLLIGWVFLGSRCRYHRAISQSRRPRPSSEGAPVLLALVTVVLGLGILADLALLRR